MKDKGPQKIQFKPRARIIRTIGDQLISGPEAAVIELVKNAYDADASTVIIRFTPPLQEGLGRITVTDDGHGMSLDDIQVKWMEPATSAKVAMRKSPSKSRVMLGSKGIGRFAAAKLGGKMGLSSVSGRVPKRTEVLILEIDWSIFSEDAYLSDISIEYLEHSTTAPTGTTIEITELNESWPEAKMSQLFLELRKLVSPLHWGDKAADFRIFLDLSLCTKMSCGYDGHSIFGSTGGTGAVEPSSNLPLDYEVRPFPLVNACDYEVAGWFDDVGRFHGTMEIRRAGQAPNGIELSVPLEDDEDSCGRVDVQLFIFDREAEVIRSTMSRAGLGQLTAKDARQILDEVAGVAIYRDGFRIRPYGDLQHDWLTLDARRVQDPSLRIGHNQVAGYIGVAALDKTLLVERSSREGFEENAAFRRLRHLIRELFAKVVEPRRQAFREHAGLSRRRSTTFDEVRKLAELDKIRELVARLPATERESADQVIDQQANILSDRIEQLSERQRVLEAQSSLGGIIAEVLHDGAPDAAFVANVANRLSRQWSVVLDNGKGAEEIKAGLPNRLELLAKSGARLRDLFATLRPLAGEKRGAPVSFSAAKEIMDAASLFESHKTRINLVQPMPWTALLGYPGDLRTALINLFANSIYWLEQIQKEHPKVDVRIRLLDTEASILIEDNGPGIPQEFVEKIFDIRFTLKDGGMGLGLNIARETLARSGATLFFHPEYEEGARFEIRFPRYQETPA